MDSYHKFLFETSLDKSLIPQITKIQIYFENMDIEDMINLIISAMEQDDHENFQSFLYYILLFRDSEKIQKMINSDLLSITLLEKIVIYIFGFCTMNDLSTEIIFDEFLFFIDQNKLLNLLISSDYISRDKMLMLYVLSKLDNKGLNSYFSKKSNVIDFIKFFTRLPDEAVKNILVKNYRLFQYMIVMSMELEENANVSDFFAKYKNEMDNISKLNDMIHKYKGKSSLETEKSLPINKRNMNRIAFLVNKIREMDNPANTIAHFQNEDVFADEEEKKLIEAIVFDPMFKNTFRNYDSMFLV
ncbi:MAG: hypothetical protein JW982_12735 [Spirochaetes bacterium]|nr:hypothetical protein [Spirochaetota bacterium]